MTREEKDQLIDVLADQIKNNNIIYVADVSDLNAEKTHQLRSLCFKRQVKLQVVKNTLAIKAMERSGRTMEELFPALKGNSSLMFAESGNTPAKLIKEFRGNGQKPILKAAYIHEAVYMGDDQLELLCNLKSKNELIGDIVLLLQSPAKNVVSALKSGGGKLAGILKTLSEKES